MASNTKRHYDYIFTGGGLSALMTVYKMLISDQFAEKSILIIDDGNSESTNKTWCFWTKKETLWDDTIANKWHTVNFIDQHQTKKLLLKPYIYNQIPAINFYNFVLKRLENQPNIHFIKATVTNINELPTHVFVSTMAEEFTAERLINSVYDSSVLKLQHKYPLLQQHFVGWTITTTQEIFDATTATFMDFSVSQENNTRFMYVLPFSAHEALIEYTLFSKDVLSKAAYEEAIHQYLVEKGITDYQISSKEQGAIPMTSYPFWKKNTKRVTNIGTAGGWTKASTGYTFVTTDKKSTQLVAYLQQDSKQAFTHKKTKFYFYDRILVSILFRKNHLGRSIFSSFFKNSNPALIFKFLDEETNFYEDLKVIWNCPKRLFLSEFLRLVFKF